MGSGLAKFQEDTLVEAGLKEPETDLTTKVYENGDIYEGIITSFIIYSILVIFKFIIIAYY